MSGKTDLTIETEREWVFALVASKLAAGESQLVRVAGRQIAVFNTDQGFRACDNRCPHEGYPLSQGSLATPCILTCNWHNWKFNLEDGENLFGGDRLRTYAVERRDNELWLDLTEAPREQRRRDIENNLRAAFDDHSYDRLAREIARLMQLGDDPLDVLRLAIIWSWERLEFGWTHAYAGMADWLILYDEYADNAELQLSCLLEAVGHTAYDLLREPEFPYADEVTAFDAVAFLQAVEREDQNLAVAQIRGGLRDSMVFADFEEVLCTAALAHYNDFGHSLIYITKAKQLINRLGTGVQEAILLSLVRSICYASREDKIPEFAFYHQALQDWGKETASASHADYEEKSGIDATLKATLAASRLQPLILFQFLLEANALNLLNFDISQQQKIRVSVSGNIGWLDFTHAITFANAVRKQCTLYPHLWPQGLLQLACFYGRNSSFSAHAENPQHWLENSAEETVTGIIDKLCDHGQGEYIVSVHWLKLALAVREEISNLPQLQAEILAAGLNRFIRSPFKRKHLRRTAYQSLRFIAREQPAD